MKELRVLLAATAVQPDRNKESNAAGGDTEPIQGNAELKACEHLPEKQDDNMSEMRNASLHCENSFLKESKTVKQKKIAMVLALIKSINQKMKLK